MDTNVILPLQIQQRLPCSIFFLLLRNSQPALPSQERTDLEPWVLRFQLQWQLLWFPSFITD